MKFAPSILVTFLLCFACDMPVSCVAQDVPPVAEQQLEILSDADQAETEDDSYLQELEQFRKNPVDLNTADESLLKELHILSGLQVENLISYRSLLGKFINIYELQAIPSWDIQTIRKLLPFVTISPAMPVKEDLHRRLQSGEQSLLLRVSQVLERSQGYDHSGTGTKYLGSAQKIFFRYRYGYKNLLQFGVAADKDAGEQFFRGAQPWGFDFYSFHLFVRKIGIIQSLAIGDFTVNMGQGLIQWQTLAFKKSVAVMDIKRQSPILRPYNSAGEFNFHRGLGLTVKKGKTEATLFASLRRVSANRSTDTLSNEEFVSSFLTLGYNRTANEIADRNSLGQFAFGGNLKFRGSRGHFGINGVYYRFSLPVKKRDEPYNLFAISGNKWYNASFDYSFTRKNVHFFGEAAIDMNFHKAIVNGLLISADPCVDLSILHRHIDKEYQAINGNGFTENTSPSNENGIYAGISLRPGDAWRLDAYADIYQFPWLRYLADAPGYGRDFLTQLTYIPTRQAEIYVMYRNEAKENNQAASQILEESPAVTNHLASVPRKNLRIHLTCRLNNAVSIRNRIEIIWYDKNGNNHEDGFLAFFDLLYKPLMKPYSGSFRVQYFETDGYNSRLYAYENDVLYSYSIPAFYDKGYRYYLAMNFELTRKLSAWLRWSQTLYINKENIGTAPDEVKGNRRSEIKLQARYLF